MIMLKYRRLSEAKMVAGGDDPSDYPYNAFCPNCGHGLQTGDNFCRHCGRATESPMQPDDVASSDEVATDAEVLDAAEIETDHHLEDCQT